MEHIEFTQNHASILGTIQTRKNPTSVCEKILLIYAYKVGENLIFLCSFIYFILGFGRHIEL